MPDYSVRKASDMIQTSSVITEAFDRPSVRLGWMNFAAAFMAGSIFKFLNRSRHTHSYPEKQGVSGLGCKLRPNLLNSV